MALTVAAGDHARSFADAVERYAPYAPMASARATAEVCGQMAWLCEAGIGARERVRRMTNERLRSFNDELEGGAEGSGPGSAREAGDRNGRGPEGDSRVVGLSAYKVYLAPDPPGMGDLVANLFDEEVGGLMYHLMSSTSHGRVAGMMRAVVADPERGGAIGPQTGRHRLPTP